MAILENGPHRCSLELSLHVVGVLTAILSSAETGSFERRTCIAVFNCYHEEHRTCAPKTRDVLTTDRFRNSLSRRVTDVISRLFTRPPI
ncbi:hypothetical protein AGR7B_pAt0297 [Agrobacterium deltaense RV3]|nr:hypothetical protein AGR7B_pAt0297 [Agrobacterium deltaense RV3]